MGYQTTTDTYKNCPAWIRDSEYQLLLTLAALVDDKTRGWWIHLNQLADTAHMGRSTAIRAMEKLLEWGVIIRHRSSKQKPYTYRIVEYDKIERGQTSTYEGGASPNDDIPNKDIEPKDTFREFSKPVAAPVLVKAVPPSKLSQADQLKAAAWQNSCSYQDNWEACVNFWEGYRGQFSMGHRFTPHLVENGIPHCLDCGTKMVRWQKDGEKAFCENTVQTRETTKVAEPEFTDGHRFEGRVCLDCRMHESSYNQKPVVCSKSIQVPAPTLPEWALRKKAEINARGGWNTQEAAV